MFQRWGQPDAHSEKLQDTKTTTTPALSSDSSKAFSAFPCQMPSSLKAASQLEPGRSLARRSTNTIDPTKVTSAGSLRL